MTQPTRPPLHPATEAEARMALYLLYEKQEFTATRWIFTWKMVFLLCVVGALVCLNWFPSRMWWAPLAPGALALVMMYNNYEARVNARKEKARILR